ncbi:MAG: amidase [Pirellulales bacterium]|nr:amidase [Pirellulales bacterium]
MPHLPSACEASRQVRSGELDPVDLVEQCLAAVDRYDESIRAWVGVSRVVALRHAERIASARARGKDLGPLGGVPIGIKDIIDVAGLPTRAGYPLRGDRAAPVDAVLVTRLRRAGAIVLGKTVTTQFACFDPSPTRNPWDPELRHSPGGSSSGSAAAVAAGMSPVTIGTQTGGSLVRPSSYCGVAAMKPTFGTVPIDGIVPVAHRLDHPGPIARTVEDLHLILGVISDLPVEELLEPALPPRLGLVGDFYMTAAEPRVRQAVEAALDKLCFAEATLEEVALPPSFREVHRMHGRIMAVEAAAYHRAQFLEQRDSYGPNLRSMLEEGIATTVPEYEEAIVHQRRFRREIQPMLVAVDALVMPATDTTAPARLDTTGPSKFQAPWSYAGAPVVSIPCGLAEDGMPVALQLVGRSGEDFQLLRTARWCERQIEFAARPPLARKENEPR